MVKSTKKIYLYLISFVVVSILLYVFFWLLKEYLVNPSNIISDDTTHQARINEAIKSILNRRATHVFALICGVVMISLSTVSLQTITKNNILTPSIIGFDAIFIAIQTVIILTANQLQFANILLTNSMINFLVSSSIMICVTLLLYLLVLRKHKNDIILLLLLGIVVQALALSFFNFAQMIINPDEFSQLQALSTVSVVNINHDIFYLILPIFILIAILFFLKTNKLNVMVLGEDQSINLGINYQREMVYNLILISLAVSLTTALIGPLTFLGLIAITLTRTLYKKNHLLNIMLLTSLVSIIIIVFGQFIIEQLNFVTTVTNLINLIGGIYIIIVLLKEVKND